jgi:hypothetical protein
MAFVFKRRLALPLWVIVFTVALTGPPPTLFLLPLTTLLVIAAVGIAAIMFSMRVGAVPARLPR